MSSLHDPFDLIKTDKDMNNVAPLLPSAKINQMIDKALDYQQLAPVQKKNQIFLSHKTWWSGGLAATAACLFLFVSLTTATQQVHLPGQPNHTTSIMSHTETADDMNEFTDLVMLDTLERY